ncbi:interactor protein for cytohesin exchange factors 1 isoform X1 [Leucoraja erinacea]|uniref:interactor protein for cytohesin exchange factors 1 isoform X1 n=2 Tax=Leucoraja erinaceus TaxID=7782 RepID=UPI002457D367|nr:interactor protein for cytohesin exchange factors 1 isoform X1 [Leucoraja erinacea]
MWGMKTRQHFEPASASVSAAAAANGNTTVSLRSARRRTGGSSRMSRRRISCKDLGRPDHQGWLYKKKSNKGFIGNKWKKYWFVLKGTYLYWYINQAAEKAEGFVNLPDFKIDQGTECKKKHAIKASHSKHKNFYFAAENAEDMNTWINKMGLAAIEYVLPPSEAKTEDCWSESEQEDADVSAEAPNSAHASGRQEQHATPLQSSFTPSETLNTFSSLESTASCASASAASLSQHNSPGRQSCQDIVRLSQTDIGTLCSSSDAQHSVGSSQQVTCGNATQELNRITSGPGDNRATGGPQSLVYGEGTETSGHPGVLSTREKEQPQTSDEMEQLYKSLEQASLSPIGVRRASTKRDFRRSFIKRSKNPVVNERLHKFRTLNSTLKSKEADLAVINILLESSQLTTEKFRQWKEDYSLLLQDICKGAQSKVCAARNSGMLENRVPSSLVSDV